MLVQSLHRDRGDHASRNGSHACSWAVWRPTLQLMNAAAAIPPSCELQLRARPTAATISCRIVSRRRVSDNGGPHRAARCSIAALRIHAFLLQIHVPHFQPDGLQVSRATSVGTSSMAK
jgi:hypothetical protein